MDVTKMNEEQLKVAVNDLDISVNMRMRIAEELHEIRCRAQQKSDESIRRREARRKIEDIELDRWVRDLNSL